MLDELEVKGSGAATLDSFYGYGERTEEETENKKTYGFTLLADHGIGRLMVDKGEGLEKGGPGNG